MARKDAEKPMLPLAQAPLPPGHIQCAADGECRKPGRLWVEPYQPRERVCVDHYYAVLERSRTAA